jgi:hypothetical protein
MSEPARNWTMDSFTQVAAWYFANPPSTWCITRHPLCWCITARDGTYISSHPTKGDAAANLTAGPCAEAHYAKLNWYLGYCSDVDQPPLSAAEREAVVRAVSSIAVATLIRRFEQP